MNQPASRPPIHLAEERLSWLHRAKNTGPSAPTKKLFAKGKLTLVSFRDIGMNNIDELVQAFADLDLAVKKRDLAEIDEPMARLLGTKQKNT